MKSSISNKYRIYISILLIVIGLAIILAPKASDSYYLYQQSKIVDAFNLSQEELSDKKEEIEEIAIISDKEVLLVTQEIKEEEEIVKEIKKDAIRSEDDSLQIEKEAIEMLEKRAIEKKLELEKEKEIQRLRVIKQKEAREELIRSKTEAILKIDSIGLEIPILDGASDANLKLSISSLKETEKPWTKGNYAIAGHRSITYGRNFNRLDDLAQGHEIDVIAIDGTRYKYVISEKFIVHEEDVSVLYSEKDKQTITLITCHPLYEKNPPNRLIIKGDLVK